MRKIKTVVVCVAIFIMGYTLSLVMNPTMSEADLTAFAVSIMTEEGEARTIGEWVLTQRERMYTEGYNGFYLYGYDLILCGTEDGCLHETAHWIDENLDFPSKKEEFRTALDNFIKECERVEDIGTIDYYCNLQRFPGINNNELDENGWGGYTEAYAEMYIYNMFQKYPMPEIFIEFYK